MLPAAQYRAVSIGFQQEWSDSDPFAQLPWNAFHGKANANEPVPRVHQGRWMSRRLHRRLYSTSRRGSTTRSKLWLAFVYLCSGRM